MTEHFSPGEEAAIFSFKYDTIFWLETKTTNPVQAPGWNELLLQSDVQKHQDYIRGHKPNSFTMSDEFAVNLRDPYRSIRDGYDEIGPADGIALFTRRLALP